MSEITLDYIAALRKKKEREDKVKGEENTLSLDTIKSIRSGTIRPDMTIKTAAPKEERRVEYTAPESAWEETGGGYGVHQRRNSISAPAQMAWEESGGSYKTPEYISRETDAKMAELNAFREQYPQLWDIATGARSYDRLSEEDKQLYDKHAYSAQKYKDFYDEMGLLGRSEYRWRQSAKARSENLVGTPATIFETVTDAATGGSMDKDGFAAERMRNAQEANALAMQGLSTPERMAYGAIQSAIDMGVNTLLTGGKPLNLMALQAGAGKAYDVQADGGSAMSGLVRGSAAAAFERILEAPVLDKLKDIATGVGGKGVVSDLLKTAADEGLEEGASYVLNYLADLLAKDPNASFSIGELLENMGTGALSGGFMGAGAKAVGTVQTNARNAELGSEIQQAGGVEGVVEQAKSSGDAALMKLAKEVASNNGKNAQRNIGKLANETASFYAEKADNAEYDAIYKGVETRLRELGEDANAPALAEIITDRFVNPQHKASDNAPVNENANAKTVMGEMLSTGKHRPEWVTAVTEEASSQRKSAGDSLAFVSAARVNTAVETNGVKTRLAGIVENDDGETVAKLSTGETAPIASIAFASPETEMLYKQAERLGFKAATADNFIKMYTGGDPVQYAEDYTRVYSIGKSGVPIAQAFKLAGELDITSPTIRAAYLAGQIEADQSAKAKQADLDAAKETFAKAGIAGKKGSVDTSVLVGMELTEQQKASVQAVKRIAEVLGINAKFVMSEVDENGNRVGKNGSYNRVTNAFEFDIWAGSNTAADTNVAIIRTVSHELTHYIQKWSPAQYNNLKSFLLRQYSNDALEALAADKMRVAEANGITLSYEDAVDEVVADACEMMLRDSTAINTLAKENRTLFDHIRGWLKNVSDAMRKAFSGVQANSLEARILESNLEAMQQVQKMWDDALVDASKADKAASHIGVNIVNQTVPSVEVASDGIPKAVTSSFAASKGTQYCVRSLLEADNKFIMPIGGSGKPKFLREKGKAVRKSGLQVTLDVAEANGVSKTQRDRIERELKSMAQLLKEAAATYRFIGLNDVNNAKLLVDAKSGTVVLSAMVKNGDYPVNFDLTKICKKREAVSKFVDALSNRKGRNGGETLLDEVNLSQGDLWKINTILRDAGYETACLGCFVESKRYNIEQWATSFVEKWNGVVDKIAPNAGYFDFSKKEVGVSDLSLSDIDRLTKLLTKPAKDKGSLKNRMSNTKAEKAKSVADEIKSIKENGLTMDYILRTQESQNTESETYKKSKVVGDKKIAYFMERLTGGEAVTDADIKYLRDKGILRGSNLSNLEKIDVLVASDGAFQKKLRVQDLITPQGITNLTALSTEFAGIVSGHYGSGTPKFAQGFAPYNSEIALLPDKAGKTNLRDYLYKIAGARMQSFSDFKIENVLDYMQMIADLSIRNLPAHAYTKEIAFARLFGKTGMKINLSVMFDIDPSMGKEYAGLTRDADGSLVYLIGDKARSDAEYERTGKRTFVQSIGFDEAVALQNEDGYSSNVGIIGVGYSNAHILMMLDDERFRYIIPYHKSGLPTEISEATHIEYATDYTSVQNTLELKGIVDADGKTVRFNKAKWFSDKYAELGNWSDVMTAFNQYIKENGYRVDTVKADAGHGKFDMYQDLAKTNDPKKTCQNYIGRCLQNDMFPMFYEFAGHENYYKMNFDFGMYDTITGEYAPQGDVQFNFPDDLHELVHEYMLAQNEANRFAEENFEPTLDAIYNTIKKPAMQELARFEVKPVSRKAGKYDLFEQNSLRDSTGKTLSPQQAEFFKDSKVRDENGNLLVMWHGTASDFTVFDIERAGKNWGGDSRLGKGFYFADNEQDALRWTEGTRTVKAYLNITNPLDVDAPAPQNIVEKIDEYIDKKIAAFDESKSWITKEQYAKNLQRIKDMYMKDVSMFITEFKYDDSGKMTDGIREFLSALGYDGIVSKNETVAFYPEQIKLTTNTNPTADPDIRYSLRSATDENYMDAVNRGDTETAQMMVDEAASIAMPDSKIRGKDGKLIPVYHGTKDMFYAFDPSVKGGVNGTAEGFGIYTSDDPEVTGAYGDRQIKMYANITKPAASTKKTITASKLTALIKDTCKREAQQMVADGEYDNVKDAIKDTWISNYVYTYDISIEQAYRDVANKMLRANDNDMDIIQEVMSGMAIRDYNEALDFYKNSLTPITGFDGFYTQWENGRTGKKSNIILAFDSSQLKLADAVVHDDEGNVIPLSERFNSENKDIRYSLRDQSFVRAEQKLADDIYYGQKLSESRDKQDAKIKEIRSRYEKKIADIRETNKDKRKALRAEYKAKMEAEVAEVRKTHYAVEARIREQYKAKLEAEVETRRESLKGYRENVKARDLRKRIKKYRDDMKNRVLRPTDNKYVPSYLIDGAIAVADLLQEATLSAEGTKARAKQESIRSALYDLKAQYDQLKADRDPSYKFEYDEEFSDKISELAQALGKKTVSEMSYEELQDVYTILKDIRETITGAARLIVKNEAYTTYEMGAKIIDEINASRGRTNLWNQFVANEVMSPLIAVRRMNDYNEDAGLVKLFDALNEGTRKADRFTMESHQMFDALRTGKDNLKAFNDAVNEKVTLPFTDSEGNEIKASKMQVMQILLSWQREVSSDGKMSHLTKGGVVIPDSKLLEKGDVRAAVSKGQRTGALTIEQIDSLMDLLSDWDKDFMRTAHRFFNVKAKQAINEATIETKHREIALSKDYIPFSVDKDFTPGAEITGLKYDNTINGMGMLKSIVQNAGQPIVIHGLNQVVDRHIADTAKVYGLSVPVKNLNKVLAVQKPGYTESVRSAITKKYHGEGIKLIDNAIGDIQSPRTRENNAVNRMLNKLNTAFIKNALVANISVTIKQSSSYFVAGRYISMPVLAKHYGEVLKVFGNTNSDYAQRLFAEIDEHTAAHWIRRQGLAFSEFAALSQDKGVYGKLEAYLRDKPSLVNALNWIQNMDVATTAAMWNACKEEVENTLSLKEGDKGYWEAVTDLYNKAVEETQSTYDSLHRGELLKGTDGLLRSLVLFQTEPMKHSAMLYAAGEKMQIMRAKGDSEGLKQAKQEFSDLTKSLLISQIAFVLMTLLSRIVLHKMNSYREEDTGDVTAKSVLTGSGKELAENAIGIAVPLVGNYLPDIIGLVTGKSKYDAFSVPTVDLMNDIVSSVSKVSSDPSMENLGKLVLTAGGLVGIPAQNLWNIVKGASLHMEDAANGEFAKFEAGYDRTGAQYVASASELFRDGKRDAGKAKVSEFVAAKKADYVADGYSDEEAEKKAKSAVKTALTNYYKPLYLAASEKERAEIRKTMWAFGVYSSTDDVVKKCNDWLRK